MNVLSRPRHRLIEQAFVDAKRWCAGKVIDGRPALAHAIQVALTIDRHAPHAGPDVIAAALLHDAPELAPPDLDLDVVLSVWYNIEVHHIVRALWAEHEALNQPDPPIVVDDPLVVLASTADRIVAFLSLLHRARTSGDTRAFFAARPSFVAHLPYFRRCQEAAVGIVPETMSDALGHLLTLLDARTAEISEVQSC